MNIPSHAEAKQIVRKLNLHSVMSVEYLAEFGIRFMREALASTQEPARFNGEQALAEWEGKHGGGK